MAPKGKTEGGERSNRFRFVMLEADLSDMNVNALAQAIVSALRPDGPSTGQRLTPPPVVKLRLSAPPVPASNGRSENLEHDAGASQTEEITSELAVGEEDASETPSSAPARARKPTKPTQPKYVDSLFASPPDSDAFKAFVGQYPTQKHSERYLVASLYLRDHGNATVNMDKIYTCYRLVGWPMTVNDWDVNLRNQLRNDRFRRTDDGYAITTAGENVVQQLRAGS
jgi:hypothetical protein